MNTIVITGGCGFIGCNAVAYYLKKKFQVIIIDNLSRKGSTKNLEWIKSFKIPFIFYQTDICDYSSIKKIFEKHSNIQNILHLAGQVAVTTSILDPRSDFEINALGTFNLLECTRLLAPKAIFIYSSTNKVFGGMEEVKVIEKTESYQFDKFKNGISENFPLDFHSPYGCSKGAADQYVLDYSRIYGLKGFVFRQSCIYGLRQFGVEDQGWVAHFIINIVLNKPIIIYGNGKQVRDILFVEDLIQAYDSVISKKGKIKNNLFNVGGGKQNAISLIQLIQYLEKYFNRKIKIQFKKTRAGDQKIFISNNDRIMKTLHWKATTYWKEGVAQLIQWVQENRSLFLS